MSTCPLVSVIIPTFNRKNDLLSCLNSIKDSTYTNLEIIVVDNASTDGTYDAVKETFPNVKLIRNEKNLGVTGGRNRGAIESKGDYLLFLDHDMVIDRQMIEELLKVLESDTSIGVAGPVIYYYDEPSKVWAAGTSIDILTGKVRFNTFDSSEVNINEPFDVQVLPAAFMVKRDVLHKVGLFDDVFFAVYEDTDFCFRIKEAGFRVVCVPKAKAWHKVPTDLKEQELHVLSRSYYIARNRIIFMKKHAKPINFIVFLTLFVPIYAVYYTWRSLRHWKLRFISEYWKGLFDGIRHAL
jgi:GT2 family glycosyltransferase